MTIIGIDPGQERSAWVYYESDKSDPEVEAAEADNRVVAQVVDDRSGWSCSGLVIEWPVSYGLPVGNSIFQTCRWIGKFESAFKGCCVFVTRPDIVRHFCGRTHYKDPDTGAKRGVTKANVKAALYERFGGDRKSAVGTKKNPGPLHGMKGDHVYDALACAVWYAETMEDGR